VLVEGGFDQQWKVFYPLSGLTGDLFRVPTLGLSLGLSSIAEIQIDWTPYQRLSVNEREPAPLAAMLDFTGEGTTDIDDIVIGTKVRLVPEGAGHPAFGVRFATKLPNASNESGLGTDSMDFHVSGLVGKTVESIRIVGNVGLGLLGDPVRGDQQNDVLTYGFSLARAVRQGLEVVGEINGRQSLHPAEEVPVGTESRSIVRIGGRYTVSTVRVDGGVLFGLTSRDPSFGVTAGVTWVFRGFTIP
jgi:Putative MetA-pathway of phenol degradation